MAQTQRIVIIGAGFSGTVLAARLLREAVRPTRVVLFNRSGPVARGVAYGTRSPLHVLNVPAGRMSAFPEDEEQFINFCRRHDPNIVGGSFVPRSLYGQYLQQVLTDAQSAAAPGATLETVVGEAVDVRLLGDGVSLSMQDGSQHEADVAVIASGNYAPADPPIADRSFYSTPKYIRDPWASGALDPVAAGQRVLLIGTGLTMFDIALELNRRGVTAITAVSRRGLLPQAHRSPALPPSHEHLPPGLLDGEATARAYLRAVRRHIAAVKGRGIDWRDVVASLRPHTPALWQRLPTRERLRFVDRLRPFWDVHRHRAAPGIWAAISTLIEERRLRLIRGRILTYQTGGGDVAAIIRPRGAGDSISLPVDWVVNCTGPDNNAASLADPLITSLRQRGLIRLDDLGMGPQTDDAYRLLAVDGIAQPALRLLGPLLRGKYWEATAVPELREHARRLAGALVSPA